MTPPCVRLLLLAAVAAPSLSLAAPRCNFAVGNALAFGPYDPLAAAHRDSASTLVYQCPPGQQVRISLDSGASGTFASREMRQGSEILLYNLYLDAARTVVWGDGTGGSSVGPGVEARGAGGATTAWVFGRIPAAQDAVPGTFADTIRVTFDL